MKDRLPFSSIQALIIPRFSNSYINSCVKYNRSQSHKDTTIQALRFDPSIELIHLAVFRFLLDSDVEIHHNQSPVFQILLLLRYSILKSILFPNDLLAIL